VLDVQRLTRGWRCTFVVPVGRTVELETLEEGAAEELASNHWRKGPTKSPSTAGLVVKEFNGPRAGCPRRGPVP
jgi:hypothetical protein